MSKIEWEHRLRVVGGWVSGVKMEGETVRNIRCTGTAFS